MVYQSKIHINISTTQKIEVKEIKYIDLLRQDSKASELEFWKIDQLESAKLLKTLIN